MLLEIDSIFVYILAHNSRKGFCSQMQYSHLECSGGCAFTFPWCKGAFAQGHWSACVPMDIPCPYGRSLLSCQEMLISNSIVSGVHVTRQTQKMVGQGKSEWR